MGARYTGKVDSGCAWFILAVAVLLNMLGGATMCSFGVFYIEILKRFEATNKLASAVGLFLITSNGFSGLFLGPIIRRFGPRMVGIIGTALHSGSLIITIFVDNVYGLFFTFGILPGVGMGCQQMAALATAQLYFERRRGLAIGITTLGFAVSNFAFGPICAFLIEEFGWKGALLLLAGIILQGFVLSAFILPIDVKEDPNSKDLKTIHKTHLDEKIKERNQNVKKECAVVKSLRKNSGDLKEHRCCSRVVSETGLSFFCIPLYALFWIGMVMNEVGHGTPGIYLPLRAVSLGVGKQAAAFTVSTMGIVSTVAKVVAGFLVDLRSVRPVRPYLCGLGAVITGIVASLSVLIMDFTLLLVYSGMHGALAAIYVVMQFATYTDFYGRKNSAIFVGHVQLAAGVATAILTSLAGALLDASGDASRPFLVNGSVQVAGGFLLIAASLMFQRMGTKGKKGCISDVDI